MFTGSTNNNNDTNSWDKEGNMNYHTFLSSRSSEQLIIPQAIQMRVKPKNKALTNKQCQKIITHWIRRHSLSETIGVEWSESVIFKYYSCIYLLTISYCIKMQKMKVESIGWSTVNKSSIIKLLNTNQTFIIKQDAFRYGKNKKRINFKELNKCHSIRLDQPIPSIDECNMCSYELEIFQKCLDWKTFDCNIADRKYSALCGLFVFFFFSFFRACMFLCGS